MIKWTSTFLGFKFHRALSHYFVTFQKYLISKARVMLKENFYAFCI